MSYQDYINSKLVLSEAVGLDTVPPLRDHLFDFQRDIVSWALKRGKAAIFADCGMGKTAMQLEWASHIPGNVLILAPLAVSQQTVREGEKFGITVKYCREQEAVEPGITITNYEMLEHFDPNYFTGVVLDESSIIKHRDGKYRSMLIEAFAKTPYRLACTATPAPNDYMELGNHSEFLGIMNMTEMLATFFVHDGGETQKWRIKGHAQSDFWTWLCSWAIMIRKPSDLGYSDDGFILPPIKYVEHKIAVAKPTEGFLFALEAQTLSERIAARRSTVSERVSELAYIVNRSDEPWIIWCNLNAESEMLADVIDDAVEIRGSDNPEYKAQTMLDFSEGRIRVLVTKASVAGFGLNWQHCNNVGFVGLSDSWEQYYQAVRRCWRFGQKNTVNVHIVTASTEGAVLSNIKRKEKDAEAMAKNMVEHMKELNIANIQGAARERDAYATDIAEGSNFVMYLGDCCDSIKKMPDNSIHYSIFSPPFASLYTYSNSARDMGNCKDDDDFYKHFAFLIDDLYRVIMPGRLVSFHCMNMPTSKTNHGYIGIRDFRGDLIRLFEKAGFIFHSEVCIWKDPVTAMQRTKALGLLHKQLKKDSCMSRQGIPDYLVTMRKPGDNEERVTHTAEDFPVQLWQNYASPVWMDINPSDTLQYRSAREHDDERHICPLQLEVIRRGLKMWSNPGDTVLSPFAGIGSEGYVSLQEGRRFIGFELKKSYYEQAVRNLKDAEMTAKNDLFTLAG